MAEEYGHSALIRRGSQEEDMVGAGRFELPTSWSQTRRPAAGPRPVSLVEKNCGLVRGMPLSGWYPRRGSNSHLWLRRPALYPLSYGDTLFNWPKKDTTLAAGVTSQPVGRTVKLQNELRYSRSRNDRPLLNWAEQSIKGYLGSFTLPVPYLSGLRLSQDLCNAPSPQNYCPGKVPTGGIPRI